MASPIALGDIIAASELCFKLYRNVYQVSKGAPEELKSLQGELSEMMGTLKILDEDLKRPDSTIAQAGTDRVTLMEQIVGRTREVLESLEKLSKKYQILEAKPEDRRKRDLPRLLWNQLRYAEGVKTIDDHRAKLSYQRGVLTLLLISGQNSSLERIQSQNARIGELVEEIRSRVNWITSTKVPLLNEHPDEQFRWDMTQKMMQEAEKSGMSWSSISLDSWLQSGKWWLMKAQSQLYVSSSSSQEHYQSHANLLKASWIVTEVLATHPHLSFMSSGSQQLELLRLGKAVAAEHKNLQHSCSIEPKAEDLLNADLGIWGTDSRTSLMPSLGPKPSDRPHLWKTKSGDILYQRFAHYTSRYTKTEVECIVILEARSNPQSLRLVAQTSDGHDALSQDVLQSTGRIHIQMPSQESGRYSIVFSETAPERRSPATEPHLDALIFSNPDAARLLYALLKQTQRFRSLFPLSVFDLPSLRGATLFMTLIDAHSDTEKEAKATFDEDIRLLSDELSHASPSLQPVDLWDFAMLASKHPGHSASFHDPLRELHASPSPISLICWSAPSDHAYFSALDLLLGSDWSNHRAEILQAAIYRGSHTFLKAVMHRLGLPPKETQTSITELLKQNTAEIIDICGIHVLTWASLMVQSSDILQDAIKIYIDSPEDKESLQRLISYAVLSDNEIACATICHLGDQVPILERTWREASHAIRKRSYVALEAVLRTAIDRFDVRKETLLALLTFDPRSIELLKRYGRLAPNIGFEFFIRWAYDTFSYSEIGIVDHPYENSGQWFEKEVLVWDLTDHRYWPLKTALRLRCDPGIIRLLLDAGALLCHAQSSSSGKLTIREHVASFVCLDGARADFEQAYVLTRKTFVKFVEGDGEEPVYTPEAEYMTFVSAAELLGVELEEGPVKFTGDELSSSFNSRKVTGGRDSPFAYPPALETQESHMSWRNEVLQMLEEQEAKQRLSDPKK